MTFFDESKSILENIYFLCTPILILIGVIGLKQLKIAKDSIKINSKRQAITMSFEICEKYETSLKKKYQVLSEKMISLGINPEIILATNPSKLTNLPAEILENLEFKKAELNFTALDYAFTELANELEGFSTAFVKGIADEELAYDLQFTQFYYWATICIPAIHVAQKSAGHPVHQILFYNLCELYSVWKGRNENEIISRQVTGLLEKKSSILNKSIFAFGTK